MTDEKPMTVDALMAMVNRYAEACDDLGTDLFAQDATKHAALRAAAAGIYAQIRAGIEQYGKEQYARGVNDAWPAGSGSGEPVAFAYKSYAELERVTDDLAALVRQLVRSLRKAAPDNELADKALDYLKRKGLQGSPLRHNTRNQPDGQR